MLFRSQVELESPMGVSWSFGFSLGIIEKGGSALGQKVFAFCVDNGRCSSRILDFGLAVFSSKFDSDLIGNYTEDKLSLL